MRISFRKVHMHHFMSFDDSTAELGNRGYCLIKGINDNPKDASASNGSGKSSISNAISYCLFGETLSGLKSNLPNKVFNDGCFVELEFDIDGNSYRLIRSKDDPTYGTNLRIYVNGEDKSGKTLTDSKDILEKMLPDLTKELVGSVILLGQGLPQRFTANSPSGRKEVLEHLTKSDFMIQEIKQRIESRDTSLNMSLRQKEDELLKSSSQMELLKNQKDSEEATMAELVEERDNAKNINLRESVEESVKSSKANLAVAEEEADKINSNKSLIEKRIIDRKMLSQEKQRECYESFHSKEVSLSSEIASLSASYNNLSKEIERLQSITDICPTCGQKIPGVVKPDTSRQEEELEKMSNSLHDEKASLERAKDEYKEAIRSTEAETKAENAQDESEIDKLNKQLNGLGIEKLRATVADAEAMLRKYEVEHATRLGALEGRISDSKAKILSLDKRIKESSESIEALGKSIESVKEHLAVISKMGTYAKRDFRGLLLSNSIEAINAKSKRFAPMIFGTDDIEFTLNGNNLDIIFQGKDYESLSGGERQRVDLITQFAIRGMLSERNGFSSNILFLDEITDSLDRQSCDKVIQFITDELKDTESVFIITHHNDLDMPYDSQIIVRKDTEGVSNIL